MFLSADYLYEFLVPISEQISEQAQMIEIASCNSFIFKPESTVVAVLCENQKLKMDLPLLEVLFVSSQFIVP